MKLPTKILRKYGIIIGLPLSIVIGAIAYTLGLDLASIKKARSPEERVERFIARCEKASQRTAFLQPIANRVSKNFPRRLENLQIKLVFQSDFRRDALFRTDSGVWDRFCGTGNHKPSHEKIVGKQLLDGRSLVITKLGRGNEFYFYSLVQSNGDWKIDRKVLRANLSQTKKLYTENEFQLITKQFLVDKPYTPIPSRHRPNLKTLFDTSGKTWGEKPLVSKTETIEITSKILGIGTPEQIELLSILDREVPLGTYPLQKLLTHTGDVVALRITFNEHTKPIRYVSATCLGEDQFPGPRLSYILSRAQEVRFYNFEELSTRTLQDHALELHDYKLEPSKNPYFFKFPHLGRGAFGYWALDENDQIVSFILDGYSHNMSPKLETISIHLEPGWLKRPVNHPLLSDLDLKVYFTSSPYHPLTMLIFDNVSVASGELSEFKISRHGRTLESRRHFLSIAMEQFDLGTTLSDDDEVDVEFKLITGFGE